MLHSTFSLSADEIDDLIYFSRAGDLESLRESIEEISKTRSCSAYSIVTAAIDRDEDGLGSGCCLLHYPAANGRLEVVAYLLSLISSGTEPVAAQGNSTDTQPQTPASSTRFVNHQNVSGNTALHWAGMNGHLEIVQALVKAGADPEIINAAGRDAVVESEWSSKEGADKCAVWILKECGALEKGLGHDAPEGESSETLADDIVEDKASVDAGAADAEGSSSRTPK